MNKLSNALLLVEITTDTLCAVLAAHRVVPQEAALLRARRAYQEAVEGVGVLFLSKEETVTEVVVHAPTVVVERDYGYAEEPPISEAEVGGCKALLLEIIRRASYDWVLYRTSKVLQKRRMAEDAFNWLFKEGPGQTEWLERIQSEKEITSFMAICESLDLGVEMVRNHIRRLTVKNVMSIGRPAEYRRQEQWQEADDSYPTSMGDRALSEVVGYDDMSSFETMDSGGSDF